MKTKAKISEMRAMHFVIAICIGGIIAFVPFILDWLWPQSSCAVASFYLLAPGGIVSGILGLRIDSPFLKCAAIASALFYAALLFILLSFRKRSKSKFRTPDMAPK
jgi:hypothetical protein